MKDQSKDLFISYPAVQVTRYAHDENVTYQQNITTLAYVTENVTENEWLTVTITFENSSNVPVHAGRTYDNNWVFISTEIRDFNVSKLLLVNVVVHDTPQVTSLKVGPAVFTDEFNPRQVSSRTCTILYFEGPTSATITPLDRCLAENRKLAEKNNTIFIAFGTSMGLIVLLLFAVIAIFIMCKK